MATSAEPQIEELLDHRDEIEASVSAYLGHEWGISEIQDLAEKSSHPSAVLSDGEFRVFAKLGLQSVPEALFSAYAEMLPIDEDFSDRRELWRMPFYLAMVEGHEGIPQYQIRAVLDRFL